jgi:hypothetical protein
MGGEGSRGRNILCLFAPRRLPRSSRSLLTLTNEPANPGRPRLVQGNKKQPALSERMVPNSGHDDTNSPPESESAFYNINPLVFALPRSKPHVAPNPRLLIVCKVHTSCGQLPLHGQLTNPCKWPCRRGHIACQTARARTHIHTAWSSSEVK